MAGKGPERRQPSETCSVLPLENHPAAVPALATLYESLWPDWYGPSGNGSASDDLRACLADRAALPRGLVALDAAGIPVGCVCLRDKSPGSDRFPGAWLTGLAVSPAHHRQGIGLALIAGAEERARQLGFPALFTATGPAERLVLTRAWQRIGTVATGAGAMSIFRHTCQS